MTMNPTHLTRLLVADKPSDATNTLTDGQAEIHAETYLVGAVDMASTLQVDAAATFDTTISVGDKASLEELQTSAAAAFDTTASVGQDLICSSGVSIAEFLTVGGKIYGDDLFDTTSTADTVALVGIVPGDRIISFPYGNATLCTGDTLSTSADTGTFTVVRSTGGTESLKYGYFIIRPS